MWTLCDTESFEQTVVRTFPNAERLAKIVVEKFQADIRMFREATDEQLRKVHVWHYGRVVVRYRFLPGMKLVEVVSVGTGRTTGRRRRPVDFFLLAILIAIVIVLILSTLLL
jgi:hypothetical protein